MKKIFASGLAILAFCCLLMFSLAKLDVAEVPLYQDLSVDEIKSKIQEKESFILFLYQKTCLSCENVKPTINDYVRNSGNPVFSLDVYNDENKGYIVQTLKLTGTPTVIFYNQGVEKRRLVNIFDAELFEATINEENIFEEAPMQ